MSGEFDLADEEEYFHGRPQDFDDATTDGTDCDLTAHTPGALSSLGGCADSVDDPTYLVFYAGMNNRPDQISEPRIVADTRRLVACWNAFVGTPTEVIERTSIAPPKGE